MAYNRLSFNNVSQEMSNVIVDGATLGKEPWEIASSIELMVLNSLEYSETRLAKSFGNDGTDNYLEEVVTYIKKYFKDFDRS